LATPKAFNIFKQAIEAVIPAGAMTVSEWADKYRILSAEASAEPGRWRTSRVPYAKWWMDVFNDYYVWKVVLKTSSQVAKSETLNNVIGYFIHHDPCPIMMVQPTIDRMKEYSKKRIAPMIRDTPALKDVVSDEKSRDSDNTTLGKSFTGGHLKMVGANAASGLASDPIRVAVVDEIDRAPLDVDGEGDVLSLVEVRTSTFGNKKIGVTSTPTIKGASKIEDEFEHSTQFQYLVPCPHCKSLQTIKWKDETGQKRLIWEADESGAVTDVHYVCDFGCAIEPHEKLWMLDPLNGAGWFQKIVTKNDKGEVVKVESGDPLDQILAERRHNGVIGFEINALYSPFAGCTWQIIAEKFVKAVRSAKAGNPEALKTFVNTMLGESWDTKNEASNIQGLEKHESEYVTDVPIGVLLLTAGIDTQPDRLECSMWGWGPDGECWLIYHEILWGDTSKIDVWEKLKQLLCEEFECERTDSNGKRLVRTIDAACIDAGGHNAEDVKAFTKANRGRNWLATFGKSQGAKEPIVKRPTRLKGGALLWALGVTLIKDKIFAQLKVTDPGPGYVHFPLGMEAEYYKQLTAENRTRKLKKFDSKDPFGYSQWMYKKIRERNETLDCFVYAFAAKEHLNPNFMALLEKENLHCEKKRRTLYDSDEEPRGSFARKFRKQQGNGFVSSYLKK
jgi:phage terminase large subunit GpA-like protein